MYTSLYEIQNLINSKLEGASDQMLAARQVLDEITNRTQISLLVNSIISHDGVTKQIAARSCPHPNGFDKIGLIEGSHNDYRLRLHIWWKGSTPGHPEDIHNHSWDFSSKVLLGSLHCQEFLQAADGLERYHYIYGRTGSGNNPYVEFIEKSKLQCVFDAVIAAGSSYTLSHKVLHRVDNDPQQTTITLVIQGPFVSTESHFFSERRLNSQKGELPLQWFNQQELHARLRRLLDELEDF